MSEHLDPWVTTSCINQDMIRRVGNALHRDMCGTDVPCIGFCNWEHVAGIFIINANVTYNSLYRVTPSLDCEQLEPKRVPLPTSFETRLPVIIFT
jgi:hypothetical protein